MERVRGATSPKALLGLLLGLLVWAWTRTLRVIVERPPGGSGRSVFAFLHGQQMALLAAGRPANVALLVSHSADGEIQSGVMRSLGFRVVRGSSSRGGAAAQRALGRHLASGDVALAVDGPRGPRGRAKPGALALSRGSGAELVPVAAAARSRIVLGRTWDAFEIPLPFSRVAVVIGASLSPDLGTAALEEALRGVRTRAEALVRAEPAPALSVSEERA